MSEQLTREAAIRIAEEEGFKKRYIGSQSYSYTEKCDKCRHTTKYITVRMNINVFQISYYLRRKYSDHTEDTFRALLQEAKK